MSSPTQSLETHLSAPPAPLDQSQLLNAQRSIVDDAAAQFKILVDLRQLREDFECWASARLHQTDDVVEARLKAGIEEITALERDQAQKDARLRAFVEQVKHAFNSLQY